MKGSALPTDCQLYLAGIAHGEGIQDKGTQQNFKLVCAGGGGRGLGYRGRLSPGVSGIPWMGEWKLSR